MTDDRYMLNAISLSCKITMKTFFYIKRHNIKDVNVLKRNFQTL